MYKLCLSTLKSNLIRKYSQKPKWPKKIFSGIQPTGVIHLGNYLGAIRHWIKLQNNNESVTFSIVDLHSITLPQDPKELSKNILNLTATLLACGIDPKKCILFLQSTVPQHTQLGWHLSCLTTMPRLSHLPQFKEKSALVKDVPLGLFIYPVLQAADILIHKATHVPVGEDQIQHLQLSHHLAKYFNYRFGPTFPLPEALIADDSSSKVKSLRDPLKKMSKSDPDPKSCINLLDPPKVILEKVKKSLTDFTSEITYEPESRLGVANLINIHSLLTGISPNEICCNYTDLNTGKYKLVVADVIIDYLKPIQEKYQEIINKPEYIREVLEEGRSKAIRITEINIQEVNEKVGTNFK